MTPEAMESLFMPSYRGLSTVVFTTDLGEQHPFASQEPHCSALLLYVLATCWSRANKTDGQIPKATIRRLASWSTTGPPVDECAAALVAAGTWADRGDGCYFDNTYESMQLTTTEEEARSIKQRTNRLGTNKEPVVNQASTVPAPQIESDQIESDHVEDKTPPAEVRPSASPPSVVPRETVEDPPAVTKPKKPPRPKREPHPMRKTYLDEFHFAHKTATGGAVYSWDPRALAALDRACETYPLDRWKAACAGYARRLPEWMFRDGSAPDVHGMIRSFNSFAAAACGAPSNHPAGPNGRLSIEQILNYRSASNGQR